MSVDINYLVEIVKMRYSTEPKYSEYVKGHRILSVKMCMKIP